ncbi:hypothetical protein S245_036212, partial [Arachis hypogaea]
INLKKWKRENRKQKRTVVLFDLGLQAIALLVEDPSIAEANNVTSELSVLIHYYWLLVLTPFIYIARELCVEIP